MKKLSIAAISLAFCLPLQGRGFAAENAEGQKAAADAQVGENPGVAGNTANSLVSATQGLKNTAKLALASRRSSTTNNHIPTPRRQCGSGEFGATLAKAAAFIVAPPTIGTIVGGMLGMPAGPTGALAGAVCGAAAGALLVGVGAALYNGLRNGVSIGPTLAHAGIATAGAALGGLIGLAFGPAGVVAGAAIGAAAVTGVVGGAIAFAAALFDSLMIG